MRLLLACFAAGTPLLTELGARSIETIRAGERIWSRNEHDPLGAVELKVVEEVFRRHAPILHLHLPNNVVIRTTSEHPFSVVGKGWVAAGALQPGDRLRTLDGLSVAVEEVYDTGEWELVYNLRVADWHTYFVGCDEWGFSVWAHNACVRVVDKDGVWGLDYLDEKGKVLHHQPFPGKTFKQVEAWAIAAKHDVRTLASEIEASTAAATVQGAEFQARLAAHKATLPKSPPQPIPGTTTVSLKDIHPGRGVQRGGVDAAKLEKHDLWSWQTYADKGPMVVYRDTAGGYFFLNGYTTYENAIRHGLTELPVFIGR